MRERRIDMRILKLRDKDANALLILVGIGVGVLEDGHLLSTDHKEAIDWVLTQLGGNTYWNDKEELRKRIEEEILNGKHV